MPKAFYHYVKMNTSSFSQAHSTRHWDELKHNVTRTTEMLQAIYGRSLDQEIAFLKLEAKFPFLIIGDIKLYKLWKEWYPEANQYILRNKNISSRNRMLQWFAWKNQYWLVWLYYILVIKLIYGIIYR